MTIFLCLTPINYFSALLCHKYNFSGSAILETLNSRNTIDNINYITIILQWQWFSLFFQLKISIFEFNRELDNVEVCRSTISSVTFSSYSNECFATTATMAFTIVRGLRGFETCRLAVSMEDKFQSSSQKEGSLSATSSGGASSRLATDMRFRDLLESSLWTGYLYLFPPFTRKGLLSH